MKMSQSRDQTKGCSSTVALSFSSIWFSGSPCNSAFVLSTTPACSPRHAASQPPHVECPSTLLASKFLVELVPSSPFRLEDRNSSCSSSPKIIFFHAPHATQNSLASVAPLMSQISTSFVEDSSSAKAPRPRHRASHTINKLRLPTRSPLPSQQLRLPSLIFYTACASRMHQHSTGSMWN